MLEQLGDYIIQKPLGKGPFGIVYLASHRFIKRTFVLKVLPEEISSDSRVFRRLENEISCITNLDHPNIAKIHNVSIDQSLAYFVMDPIVDTLGETMHLGRFLALKGKFLSEAEMTAFLRQIASALDFAHEAGVAHGGLKLSNILVAPEGNGVKLLLSDFGISRLIGEGRVFLRLCEEISAALIPNLEQANDLSAEFIKSFAFLAPEQKNLSETNLEIEKCDAYAFGVLTYYMLMGKIPEGCFDLPSRTLLAHSLNWDLLINRCLQNNPHVRPQKLILAMDEYLKAPRTVGKEVYSLGEIEPKVDSVLQMAFEFPLAPPTPVEPTANTSEIKVASTATVPPLTGEIFQPSVQPSSQASVQPTIKPIIKPTAIARPEYESDPGEFSPRSNGLSL